MALRDPYTYQGYTIDTRSAGYGGFIAHVVNPLGALVVSLPMSRPEDADQAARGFIDQFQDFGAYDPPLGGTVDEDRLLLAGMPMTIASHSFNAGDLIRHLSGTTWELADADDLSKPAQFCVRKVIDSTNIVAVSQGAIEGLSGLTIGQQWLSTVAGEMTPTRPGFDKIQQRVGVAISATVVVVNILDPGNASV